MADIKKLYLEAAKRAGKDAVDREVADCLRTLIDGSVGTEAIIDEVISDLNRRIKGRHQAKSAPTRKAIRARVREGATLEDFRHVHEIKVQQWLHKDEFKGNLRPSTLYRASHFWEYLNEWAMSRNVQEHEERKRRQQDCEPADGLSASDLYPWYEYETFDDLAQAMWQLKNEAEYDRYECPPMLKRIQRQYWSLHARQALGNPRKTFDELRKEYEQDRYAG